MDTSIAKKKNRVISTSSGDNKVFVKYYNLVGEKTTTEIPYEWYFVIQKKDENQAYNIIEKTGFKFSFENHPTVPGYTKVYCQKDLRDETVLLLENNGIQTFEGDLSLDRRWYIDKEIKVETELSKLYFDIETDDTLEKIQVGRDRIISFSAIDESGKKYFECLKDLTDESEIELLKKFLKLIKKYDIAIGWNSSQFDFPYIRERIYRYGLNASKLYRESWYIIAKYDLLKRFRHIFRFDSYIRSFSLEFISNHFLGHGKIKHSEKIIELYHNDRELLKRYNIEDSILVKELDEKLGVSDMMIRQSSWCGVPPKQFGLYSIIDAFILKTAHRNGTFGRTSIKAIQERYKNDRSTENPNDTDTEKSKYLGALVLDPKIGKYNKVYSFDFKSLYPSIMKTCNIGYDSLTHNPSTDSIINPGTLTIPRVSGNIIPTFFNKKPSIINLSVSELLKLRTKYKDLKLKMIEDGTNHGTDWERVVSDEIIVKELSNSTYGIMGLDYGRYYSVDVAESITLFGQWCIKYAKNFFESEGYDVIYGDTDSVFVNTNGRALDIEKELERFHVCLKKELKEKYNIDDCYIQLNFDKEYNSFLLVARKTYVGNVINIEGKRTNDLYARGLDFIKKSTFSFAARKQKELIKYIFDKNPIEHDMRTYISLLKLEFDTYKFTKEDLSIVQRVGKPVEEYIGTKPLHVRLAEQIQQQTGQSIHGVDIEYIITQSDKLMDGILAEQYCGIFDKEYYWSNKTCPVLERILKVVYPNSDFFNKNLTLF